MLGNRKRARRPIAIGCSFAAIGCSFITIGLNRERNAWLGIGLTFIIVGIALAVSLGIRNRKEGVDAG